MMTVMHIIVLLLLVLHVQQTVLESVQCFNTFSPADGTCDNLLGQVELDDCCMNSEYGYQEADGVCKSCRFASWTSWSRWSPCSVSCTEGVTQRRRSCYGLGRCHDPYRVGHIQTKSCEDNICCPVNGAWSEWGAWQPCSVTCQAGQRKRTRTCSNPPPVCGGVCEGISQDFEDCDTKIVCPTHGGWSEWGSWGTCAGSCEIEGLSIPKQQRHRTCTNPPPSLTTLPPGNDCPGSRTDTQNCQGLPFCAVNGNWGPWSESSACSVTCGVGQQTQHRTCDNPAPKYGGLNCLGENMRSQLCITPENCPANGHWNEWSEWNECSALNKIKCKNKKGQRRRVRECVGRNYGGAFCDGQNYMLAPCYDIEGCKAGKDLQIPRAIWSEWSAWSFCKPDCGENSVKTRKRECIPDISEYSDKSLDIFSGKPNIVCPPLDQTEDTQPCLNLPPC